MKDLISSPLWERYLQAFTELTSSRMAIHGHEDEIIESIKRSLLAPGWECPAALSVVPFLKPETAVELLDALIGAALSVHGSTIAVRSTIASLPANERLAALHDREQRVTETGDFEEWGCLMELWDHLGHRARAEALARRGLQSCDENVREIAARFLEKSRNDERGEAP